jgi:hypothetical protein
LALTSVSASSSDAARPIRHSHVHAICCSLPSADYPARLSICVQNPEAAFQYGHSVQSRLSAQDMRTSRTTLASMERIDPVPGIRLWMFSPCIWPGPCRARARNRLQRVRALYTAAGGCRLFAFRVSLIVYGYRLASADCISRCRHFTDCVPAVPARHSEKIRRRGDR